MQRMGDVEVVVWILMAGWQTSYVTKIGVSRMVKVGRVTATIKNENQRWTC